MKNKDKTLKRKMERKMKEYLKESIFDIDAFRQELKKLSLGHTQNYQDGIVEFDKIFQQSDINLQYQCEIIQSLQINTMLC